jgi:hypothetical protein
MVQQAMEDKTLRDAFWGPDPNPDWICPPNYPAFLPMIMKN